MLERSLLGADDLAAQIVSPSSLRKPATTPKTRRMSLLVKPEAQKWRLADEAPLKTELLALELRLSLPRQIAIGVLAVHPGQDEAAASRNPALSKAAEAFLAAIAAPTEVTKEKILCLAQKNNKALGWSGYTGGLSTKESTKFYYCGWRGLEIVFHVAPLLSESQRRQFVGNDKVLIYFLDEWRPGSKLEPKFRGQVNSVAVCVLPVAPNYYKLSAFHRLGMADTKPACGDDPMELASCKEFLLSKLVNAHVDAYNLLYTERMKRAWKEELASLADRYSGEKKKKKADKKLTKSTK